jgi:predicted dehydrogenase
MSTPRVGILVVDGGGSVRLGAAAMQHPGIDARQLKPGDRDLDGLAGVVIDAPAQRRGDLVSALLRGCRVPVLVEAPAAHTAKAAGALAEMAGTDRVVTLNPLRHALPTRRLRDRMLEKQDPLETFFAAWRFSSGPTWRAALPQLLDYVATLSRGRPLRVSVSMRRNPEVLLAILRYESGVVGSLEIGGHLPASVSTGPELLVECFCRESVHHCTPGSQAVRVDGVRPVSRDWLPDPAEHMMGVFADMLRGGDAPGRSLADDATVLKLAEQLLSDVGDVAPEES